MTFEPPTFPPAGWHPDPHRPGLQRYWNGRDWVEQWRPDPGAARTAPGSTNPHGLPDIGGWLGRAFQRVFLRWKSATILGLVAAVVPAALFTAAAGYLVRDLVITTDGDVIGWSNRRLPLAIGISLIAALILAVGYLAMQVLMLRAVDQEPDPANPVGSDDSPVSRAAAAFGDARRCLPRAIGWTLLFTIAMMAAFAAIVVLTIATGGLFALALIALIPVGLWLTIRWSFVLVAIVDAPGNPFRRSAAAVDGRWWAVFGRLLLLGIISGVISGSVNAATSGGGAGGAFSSIALEVDANGDLTNDVVFGDLVATSPWFFVLTLIGSLLLNLVTAVSLAGSAELYRTRHGANAPT